jgi:hypothetical protein
MKKLLTTLAVLLLACGIAYATCFSNYSVYVVAKTTMTGQTAAIGTTTVFTPGAAGDFRVSVYASRNATSGAFSCGGIDVSWTDEYSATNRTVQYGSSSPFVSNSVVIHSTANAITFDTVSCSGTTYDIFVTVEQL